MSSGCVSLLLPAFSPAAPAASGAETYKAKCALCHDAGATGAPRIDRPADWAKRAEKGYAGLLRSAMQGVAGTAMLPKAGFPELSESEVSEALRYMVLGAGLQLGELAKGPVKAEVQARRPAARVDDITGEGPLGGGGDGVLRLARSSKSSRRPPRRPPARSPSR